MKTETKQDLLYHYSTCGKFYAEQETKHFFYIMMNNQICEPYAIGQADIKDKEFRPNDNNEWYKQETLFALAKFLDEVYEYHKHVG